MRAVRYLIIRSNSKSIQVYGGFKNKENAEKCAELLNRQQTINAAIELQLHYLGYYDDLDIGDDSTNYYVEECDIYDEKPEDDEETLNEESIEAYKDCESSNGTTSYTDIQKFWEDVAEDDEEETLNEDSESSNNTADCTGYSTVFGRCC